MSLDHHASVSTPKLNYVPVANSINPSTNPFNPETFPGIVHGFLKIALSHKSSLQLRLVNRTYNQWVDRILLKHCSVEFSEERHKGSEKGALQLSAFLIGPRSYLSFSGGLVSKRTKTLLSFIKILDVCRSGTEQADTYGNLLGKLAPYLVNLETIRQYADLRSCPAFFTAPTLNIYPHILPGNGAYRYYFSNEFLNSRGYKILNISLTDVRLKERAPLPPMTLEPGNMRYSRNLKEVTLLVPTLEDELTEELVRAVVDVDWLLGARCLTKEDMSLRLTVASEYDIRACQNRLKPIVESLLAEKEASADDIVLIMDCISYVTTRDLARDKLMLMIHPFDSLNDLPDEYELRRQLDLNVHSLLQQVEDAFLNLTDRFTVSGTVPLKGSLGNIGIMVKEASNSHWWFNFPGYSPDRLYNAASPSPFGGRSQLVHDETYRLAREILPPNFVLSQDVLAAGSILQKIQDSLHTQPLYATVSKLNIYPEGGLFKSHRDTPISNNHLGTIILCLPSAFFGGELVVRHNGQKTVSDLAGNPREPVLSWTFLFSDCEHEVLPVKYGWRVTVAYDVFVDISVATSLTRPIDFNVPNSPAPIELRPPPKPQQETYLNAANALQTALDDPDFLPQGGVLAFGLLHEYVTAPLRNTDFAGMLKGSDVDCLQVLLQAGLSHEFVAVYHHHGTRRINVERAYKRRAYAASRSFMEYQGVEQDFDEPINITEIPIKNIHWVVKPAQWGIKNDYMALGNFMPYAEVQYVAVAIYAYIGPPGDRASGTAETILDADSDSGIVLGSYWSCNHPYTSENYGGED